MKPDMTADDLLWEWLRMGWRYRKVGRMPRAAQDWYHERIRYEMDLIISKQLADFFLFTSDAMRWGKDNGVAFGPGRGSTAASVVAWLLRITEVDPFKYPGMMFERFLDPNRMDPPDIDVDCSDEERWKIREYLAGKYGPECVGQVANFIRYRGKNSLQDVARVYNVPIAAKEQVSKLIIERSGGDSRFDSTLEDTIAMFPAAQAVFDSYPDLWKAPRLEGNVRGMSVHAAGLIVSGTPLTDICAVYERDGVRVLSIDKYDVEYAGALKLDFLGLSTMGMIARCLKMAGLTLDDLYAIPDTDQETIDVFRRGDVTGVFQFEGRATRLVNRDVHPDHFLHIADINALSRPGPLFSGTTSEYVGVRHGRHTPERYHPIVDDITRDTYGQIIYQEQILKILQVVGGFGWAHLADIRRIITKKAGEAALNVNAGRFAEGAARLHGISQETADRIWKKIVTSGTYAFNIAHAISYSLLAFWTAWLKIHYPLEFYAASLAKASDEESQFRLMKDAQNHGINITPPVLNASNRTWRPVKSLGLVAGWEQIPGIGAKTAQRIDELRWGSVQYVMNLQCGHKVRLDSDPHYARVICPEEFCGREVDVLSVDQAAGKKFESWAGLQAIPGIGPKTVETMENFSCAHDPFGLLVTGKVMARAREFIAQSRIPQPTHNGLELSQIAVEESYGPGKDGKRGFTKGPRVVYAGIVKARHYQDKIENIRSRTGEEVEDILKDLYRPDLLKYCALICHDETDEEVFLRINRFTFPKLKKAVDSIAVGHDVVVAAGNRIAGFGTPVMIDRIWVIDPD
jgi:Zierdtviridae DNA polymerase